MARDINERISSLKAKILVFTEKYDALDAERRRLAGELDQARALLRERDAEVERLQSLVANLRMSAALSPERDDIEETRRTIAGLVREIDKCILDLAD